MVVATLNSHGITRPGPEITGKHRTARHFDVAANNCIMLTQVGSVMYGTDTEHSDTDLQGVCIEPPEAMLGYDAGWFDQYIYSSAPIGEKTPADGIDMTVFGLNKFIGLVLKGDPNMTALLFSPHTTRWVVTHWWIEVARRAPMFVSKIAAQRYWGYLQKQLVRYLEADQSPRPELVEKFGWDTKAGYHAVRIALQGRHLIQSGRINYPMAPHYVGVLRDIREGKYTKDEVLIMVDEFANSMDHYLDTSPLKDEPDYDQVNHWLSGFYAQYWADREQP
jgi:predicted nucleotidyltransferase